MTRAFIILLLLVTKSVFGQHDNFFVETEMKLDSICAKSLKLQLVEETGKFGYADTTGKLLIEPQFYCATEFVDCLALTSMTKSCIDPKTASKADWYYINKNGDTVIPPRQENRVKWKKEIKTAPNTGYTK